MSMELILCVRRYYKRNFIATADPTHPKLSHESSEVLPNRSCATVTLLLLIVSLLLIAQRTNAQDTVTGAFEGTVTDIRGTLLKGADVEITNQQTGLKINLHTDNRG